MSGRRRATAERPAASGGCFSVRSAYPRLPRRWLVQTTWIGGVVETGDRAGDAAGGMGWPGSAIGIRRWNSNYGMVPAVLF